MTDGAPIRLALIGPGRWGRILVESVQGVSRKVRFSHAVSRTPEKISHWCDSHGIIPESALAGVMDLPEVDGVVLATPHSLHVPQIEALAAAGKPILCEKPLALTREGAERAFHVASQAGILLAVAHNHRFLPALPQMRRMITDGTLGNLLHLEGNMSSHVGFGEVYTPDMWRLAPGESPAGGLAAAGIHLIDLMIHLAGPITSTFAESDRLVHEILHDDTTSLLMRFACRATGVMSTSTATGREFRLQVFGENGWLELRGRRDLTWQPVVGERQSWSFPDASLERAQLETFADCIRLRAPFPLPRSEVINGISVFEGVSESLATGQRVQIDL